MKFNDAVSVTGVRRTDDGYLVAVARVARTGTQTYLGREVDPDNKHGLRDKATVTIYRPEASVFHPDAMKSYAHRPMTNGHPGSQVVNSQNWKDVAIGNTGSEVLRDGAFVQVPLVLMDAAAIEDYESGKRQLSMGYSAEIVFQDGVSPEGDAYDAYLGPMKMNHLSLEHLARGGNELRIGDQRAADASRNQRAKPEGGHDMADMRKILVDGLTIETSEQGAQAVEKLQRQLNDAATASKTLTDAHAAALAGKDADLAKKDAEIDGLKAKVLTDADIDTRVKTRADLIATAKTIVDADYTGKSEGEIRKTAVLAKLGDAALKDKPDAYIAARFDILVEDAAKDPVRQHLGDAANARNPGDNGQAAYEERMTNAWKGTNGKKEG
ncbi:MAG: DUF2213 domain-containing protein [Janthinobacterium lividum]